MYQWSTSWPTSLQHSGHVFKPLEGIYEEHKKKISEELSQLKSRHTELICLVQDVVRGERMACQGQGQTDW